MAIFSPRPILESFASFQHLTDTFSYLQTKFKKIRGTHIKEIQAFQKYFENVYNPCHLSRTIYDVTLTLKHKVTEKLSNLKVPPYVKNRYDFSLKFYFSKVPLLPTCEFGLAFRLPFLDWFICGSLSALNNELKKPRQRVISTKYDKQL